MEKPAAASSYIPISEPSRFRESQDHCDEENGQASHIDPQASLGEQQGLQPEASVAGSADMSIGSTASEEEEEEEEEEKAYQELVKFAQGASYYYICCQVLFIDPSSS